MLKTIAVTATLGTIVLWVVILTGVTRPTVGTMSIAIGSIVLSIVAGWADSLSEARRASTYSRH